MSAPLSRRQFVSRSAAVIAGATVAASAPTSGSTATSQEPSLQTLLDDAADEALSDHDAGGLAVAVVDGEDVLTSGYGHAFESEDVPVRADETLFRVGSVSKVVTWTAAMQLVDRDRLAVDAPVNAALDAVDLPQTYDRPITLEHLATHTPGFQVRAQGDSVSDPAHVRPLAESVSTDVPTRVRPPGELHQYTNYAAALTGQLLADVSGRPFGTYVADDVFEPLGMTRSTFEPAPPGLVPAEDTNVEDAVDFYSDVAPASGLHTTAADMAALLRLHLNGGVVDGERLLSERAVERMHRRWYAPHERMDGLGAYEKLGVHERLSVQGWLAAVATVTALTGLLGWPAAAGRRRFRGGDSLPASATRARWVAGGGVAGLGLFVVGVVASGIAVASMDRPTLFGRWPAWFEAVFAVPTVGALVTIVAVGYATRAWYRGDWSLVSRVHYSAVVAASAVLYWLLSYWNLLLIGLW